MRTRTIALVGTIGLAAALAWVALRFPTGSPRVPLPDPNGYDLFLKAGRMLTAAPSEPNELSTEELRTAVAQNAAALAVVREGLQQQSRVQLTNSVAYATAHMADLDNWKRMTRALVAEGKLAERENRIADAARSYVEAIRFGHECCRGGVIIDMLVGVACQSAGCQALRGLTGQLKAAECREAIRALAELESRAESAKDVAAQERAWSQRTFGWRGRVAALVMWRNLQQSTQKALAKLPVQQKTARLLLIELAERAYELEHGADPKSISELVPGFLKQLPRDPTDPAKVMELLSAPVGRQRGDKQTSAHV